MLQRRKQKEGTEDWALGLYQARFIAPGYRIDAVRDFESEDDGLAFEQACQWTDGRAVEVWEGDRFIATAEASGEMSGSPERDEL